MDTELRRIFRNAGTLLGGNAFAAILQLAALALTARALGPERYGALVLIQTWVAVVDRLVNFQSWHVVIRYGAQELEAGDARAFRAVVKLSLLLDAAGAIAGAAIAAGAIALGARLFGWAATTQQLGIAYSAVILFHLGGTATGVLRLFDRFGRFAVQTSVAAMVRLALVAWAWQSGADLFTFAIAWAAADVIGNVTLFALGWHALAREGHPLFAGSIAEARARHPDILRYALLTNLDTSLRHVFREIDVFIVRAFLDVGAVGQYQLIKQIASVPERLANPLYHSALPVMARAWAKGDVASIWRHIEKARAIGIAAAAAMLAGYLLIGRIAIDRFVGEAYAAVFVPGAIALAGTSIWAISFAYSALLQAMGLVRQKLRLTTSASLMAVALQVVLLPLLGLLGAATAFALASMMWIGSAAVIVHSHLRREA